MSANDSMFGRCDMCDSIAFDVKPCTTCYKTDRGSALCSAHSHTCTGCGESMCPDHSTVVVIDGESQLQCRECAPVDDVPQEFVPTGRDYAERVHRIWLR